MGSLQTFFYLALISAVMIGTVVLLVIVLGTAGVLYGFIRYGAS